jgi:hypothetical protein
MPRVAGALDELFAGLVDGRLTVVVTHDAVVRAAVRLLHRWGRVVDGCTHNGPRHQPTDRRVDVAGVA